MTRELSWFPISTAGIYTVTIRATGFKSRVARSATSGACMKAINVTLDGGDILETVNVVADSKDNLFSFMKTLFR